MNKKLREILERQSELISKQKTLICKLNEELQKRNLKTEEVALVLQGVTLGLKNARKGLFWPDLYVHIIWAIYLAYTVYINGQLGIYMYKWTTWYIDVYTCIILGIYMYKIRR